MSDYQHSDADAPAEDGTREPAWDLTAERSVLGALLSTAKANSPIVDEVMEAMEPTDFYQPKHETIARAIAAVHESGRPVDPLLVSEELDRRGESRAVGGAAYVFELTNTVTHAATGPFHAEIVHRLAMRRRLSLIGIAVGQAADDGGDTAAAIDAAMAALDELGRGKRKKTTLIGDTIDDYLATLDSPPDYSPTPWEGLDRILGGFVRGGLYVFAGRPGAGKTVMLTNCAVKLAESGWVAVSSLEMTEAQLQQRLIAQHGTISFENLRDHKLNAIERTRVETARSMVKRSTLSVDATPAVTVAQVKAHARSVARMAKLAGSQLSAVVVDYLQIVRGEGQNRTEVVGQVAEGLKALAKELGVPVLTGAQLRRADQRAKQPPGLDDLRESGGIEQAADAVVLLHRERETPRAIRLIVAKHRHGRTGQVTLHWQGEYMKATDRTWMPTALLEAEEMEMAG